jgi:hypothetical protein
MQLSMEQTEDYKIVLEKYGKTHFIEKRNGTSVEVGTLKPNQSVCWGDGRNYYYLLTEKTVPAETLVMPKIAEATEDCKKNGWSYNYGFIRNIADTINEMENEEDISMEQVDAVLRVLVSNFTA